MLKQEQIFACGMTMFNPEQCHLSLKSVFPDQPERQKRILQALHFYDAYLGITDAAIDAALDPMSMVGFKGFMASEVEMMRPDIIATAWTVSDWLVTCGLLEERFVQFALSQDESFDKRTYQSMRPIQERIRYYSSWFIIGGGEGIYVNLTTVDPKLDRSSRLFLRNKIAEYMRDKQTDQAKMDAEFITSILQGYVYKWPKRCLAESLSPRETESFVSQIISESDRQMANAGFSRKDAQLNLEYLLNVVTKFFIGKGLFSPLAEPD
ncbi:hypothetical protein [Pseudomonas sp.]|uniref:hypothetical protein n=1 Tax=Pseudomonas sp. TaxID=306 RepID=UPI0028A58763|nr:hypothetical protein [Pseudomonas sp.]